MSSGDKKVRSVVRNYRAGARVRPVETGNWAKKYLWPTWSPPPWSFLFVGHCQGVQNNWRYFLFGYPASRIMQFKFKEQHVQEDDIPFLVPPTKLWLTNQWCVWPVRDLELVKSSVVNLFFLYSSDVFKITKPYLKIWVHTYECVGLWSRGSQPSHSCLSTNGGIWGGGILVSDKDVLKFSAKHHYLLVWIQIYCSQGDISSTQSDGCGRP